MAARLAARQPVPAPRSADDLFNYDIDDPFTESEGETAKKKDGPSTTQSKKRKDATGLGIDEEVSIAKKPRVPRVKLDEARLLSENGIPKLRSKARNLKFKGKGHEFSDTARLLSFYQLWLDDLFPKAKFLDALSMVEKAGHKNHLRQKRIEWIGEGKSNKTTEEDDDFEDGGDSNQPRDRDTTTAPTRIASIFENNSSSSNKRAKTPDNPVAEEEEDIYGATPKRPTNGPQNITSLFGGGASIKDNGEPDEDDLDALMAEAEAEAEAENRRPAPASVPARASTFGTSTAARAQDVPEDEDDLDALMAEAEAEAENRRPAPASVPARASVFGTSTAARAQHEPEDEDDLDALMAEAEAEAENRRPIPTPAPAPAAIPKTGSAARVQLEPDEEDDLDALMAEAEAEAEAESRR